MARGLLLAVVLLATSMIIGDGVLTPAISVISAIQGLTNASSNINNSTPRCTVPPSISPSPCNCEEDACIILYRAALSSVVLVVLGIPGLSADMY